MNSLGSTLDEVSKKDKPWIDHRRNNVKVSEIYASSGDSKCEKYAERMEICASWLVFGEVKGMIGNADEIKAHDAKLKLTNAHFCRVRHCPICAWRRTLAYLARFQKHLPEYLERCPDYAYLYAVLTVENPPMDALRSTIKNMNNALKKMLKRKEFVKIRHGHVKAIEVTRGQNGLPHPHINFCMAVNKSYFTDKTYLSQARWVELWRDCLKIDYNPIVHVQRITKRKKKNADSDEADQPGADLVSGMREVIKYSVKEADLIEDPEFLIGITHELCGMRFVETSGCMKGLLSKTPMDLNEIEEVDENEMLLQTDESNEALTKMRQMYVWGYTDDRKGNYFLTKRYKEGSRNDPPDEE